ncbi:uncharacterized protein LOC100369512 [Saccoglossus kowalevskii]|uniref:Uncharacterized protein LOC100369512 n=1 Tax=Saccoglossus kowalevskii TaxID=10224 RepID=A0ABM0GN28_SACKO|nr:PREDICTED: uncharacterized protein LOC100369512 [Saccoglossus kowalevskii]
MLSLGSLIFLLVLCDDRVLALRCQHCIESNNDQGCNNTHSVVCTTQQDVCMIMTTWIDTPNSMQLSKSCSHTEECKGSEQNKSPTCYQTQDGWACVFCCHGDDCNNGGVGVIPRPPPIPPVPEPLIDRLDGDCGDNSRACAVALTWSEPESLVTINKFCSQPSNDVITEHFESSCDKEDSPDFCVSCCISEMNSCLSNVNSATTRAVDIFFLLFVSASALSHAV